MDDLMTVGLASTPGTFVSGCLARDALSVALLLFSSTLLTTILMINLNISSVRPMDESILFQIAKVEWSSKSDSKSVALFHLRFRLVFSVDQLFH
jgi:hypothetical protein